MKSNEEEVIILPDYIKDVDITMVNSGEDLENIYNKSMATIAGAGGNILEWISGLNEWMKQNNFGEIKKLYVFKGKDVNEHFNLEGDNQFQNDLTFISWEHDGANEDNFGKYCIERFKMGIRWFDDIIDNSKH